MRLWSSVQLSTTIFMAKAQKYYNIKLGVWKHSIIFEKALHYSIHLYSIILDYISKYSQGGVKPSIRGTLVKKK